MRLRVCVKVIVCLFFFFYVTFVCVCVFECFLKSVCLFIYVWMGGISVFFSVSVCVYLFKCYIYIFLLKYADK